MEWPKDEKMAPISNERKHFLDFGPQKAQKYETPISYQPFAIPKKG